jgi:hypothetical protein
VPKNQAGHKKPKKLGMILLEPRNTNNKAIIIPINKPIMKNLNSMIPNWPLFCMEERKFRDI